MTTLQHHSETDDKVGEAIATGIALYTGGVIVATPFFGFLPVISLVASLLGILAWSKVPTKKATAK